MDPGSKCGSQQKVQMMQPNAKMSRFLCLHKILVHAQDSCACTRSLCMHNTLVRAQEPGLGPKKAAVQGLGPAQLSFWDPGLVPGPSSACTRVLCMHKSVVHAQGSCACTRILTLFAKMLIFVDSHNLTQDLSRMVQEGLRSIPSTKMCFSNTF